MGVYLQSPIKDKSTTTGQIGKISYAASSMQGWRTSMEDSHITALNFDGQQNLHLFAVFDGHGGKDVAEYCRNNFGNVLKADENFAKKHFEQALTNTFKKIDVIYFPKGLFQNYLQEQLEKENKDNQLYIANVGDSRTILAKKNGSVQALSTDHKPELPGEKARIYAAGGQIYAGRINGNLNLSRAVGDLEYKEKKTLPHDKQLIISVPEIKKITIDSTNDEFLLIGCDGVYEILTNEELVKKIQTLNLSNQSNLKQTIESLLDAIIAPNTYNGSGCDNMSAIIVKLN